MSSKELYRRLATLCKNWPIDERKVGRDYAEYFRKELGAHFPQGELGDVKNPSYVKNALDSLEAIASNKYYNENSLKRSSASGLELWACTEATSNEGIKQVNDNVDENRLISRLRKSLDIKFLGKS